MKVLHISSERTWRGGEQQIAYLIEELAERDIYNFVACKKGSAFEKYCQENSLEYVSLPFIGQFDFYSAFQIKTFCSHFNIDIVHVHSSHSHAIAVMSSTLGNRVPIVLSRRVDFPIGQNKLSKWKYNHKSIKRIVCVSNIIKEIISSDIAYPKKCVTIYDGIDLIKFESKKNQGKLRREYNISKEKILVGNISAIAPHKDYFTFVNAAEKILNLGISAHFFIIGDGPLKNEIAEFIGNKKLENHITLTGFRNDIAEIFKELDIFLMTSKTEGLGSTILDAFACRVPVVATAGGGIPEIVIDQQTGLLSPVGDSDSLAENVNLLIQSKELRSLIVEGAWQKVQAFSKEIMAEKTLRLYESVIMKKSL